MLIHLSGDERFARAALPKLIVALCNQEQTLDAIASLRAISNPAEGDRDTVRFLFDLNASRQGDAAAFIHGVAALGGEGYTLEALDLLATAPTSIRVQPEYGALRARLLSVAGQEPDTAQLVELLASSFSSSAALSAARSEGSRQGALTSEERAQIELKIARDALAMGSIEQVVRLATPHLTSSTAARSLEALDLLLGASVVQPKALERSDEEIISTFLAASENPYNAQRDAATLAAELGKDELALDLFEDLAERYPTEQNLQHAMLMAMTAGDAERFARHLSAYGSMSERPDLIFNASYLPTLGYRHDAALIEPLLDRMERASPHRIAVPMARALARFKQGDVVEARRMLLEELERREFKASDVERVFYELSVRQLSSEVSRALAPNVPPERLSALSHLYIGLAEADLGFDESAREELDLYMRSRPTPGLAAMRIAEQLLLRGRVALARDYAELGVKKAPESPKAFYWRGVAHLLGEDAESARRDIDQALEMGIGRGNALNHIIELALDQGALELARHYSRLALRAPIQIFGGSHFRSPNLVFQDVARSWNESDHAAEGLAFFEQEFPEVMTNLALDRALSPTITSLYESAGSPQQTFAIYEDNILHQFITENDPRQLALYMNNLAYSHSTSQIDIERGEDLSRRSIAITPGWPSSLNQVDDAMTSLIAPGRTASYLDTLGWLEYRNGDLKQAERLIRQAIRTLDNGPEAQELYSHLADIREARGFHDEAAWMRIYVDTIRFGSNLPSP